MNPGSDIGKKELPPNIRNKFSELFIEEMKNYDDLYQLVSQKLQTIPGFNKTVKTYGIDDLCHSVVSFYLELKEKCALYLLEGTAHISLRNLARSLHYVLTNHALYGYRVYYDALFLGFGTGLTAESRPLFQ